MYVNGQAIYHQTSEFGLETSNSKTFQLELPAVCLSLCIFNVLTFGVPSPKMPRVLRIVSNLWNLQSLFAVTNLESFAVIVERFEVFECFIGEYYSDRNSA